MQEPFTDDERAQCPGPRCHNWRFTLICANRVARGLGMAGAARGPSAAAAATGRVMLVGECSICLEEIRESERRSETPEGC